MAHYTTCGSYYPGAQQYPPSANSNFNPYEAYTSPPTNTEASCAASWSHLTQSGSQASDEDVHSTDSRPPKMAAKQTPTHAGYTESKGSSITDAPPYNPKERSKSGDRNLPVTYSCLWDGCQYTTTRPYDLKRHVNSHHGSKSYPCSYSWCVRDMRPFTNRDHLDVHLRTVHMQHIPKMGKKGGRAEEKI